MTTLVGALAGGVFIGAAWLSPLELWSAWLQLAGLAILAYALTSSTRPSRDWYVAGFILHLIGFTWLISTIRDFGGFPTFLATGIYVFFAAASSVQYLIGGFIYTHLPATIRATGLAFPLAWSASNYLWIRIFPWEPGHLSPLPIAQLASIGGTQLVTFVVMWVAALSAELIAHRTSQPALKKGLALLTAVVLASVLWTSHRTAVFEALTTTPPIPVTLVQANITVEEKHNIKFFRENLDRYKRLSQEFRGQNRLLVWPESVNQEWLHTSFRRTTQSQGLRSLAQFAPLHLGTLTFDDPTSIHNSAITISGTIPGTTSSGALAPGTEAGSLDDRGSIERAVSAPYHKRVLMPFGEYVPFSSWFPTLRALVPMAAEFSAGTGPVLQSAVVGSTEVLLAPLICYEDVIQSMASESIARGGTVLISISNDGWFGDSAAPYQHHAIARFRAIETGRYFLRSTNTGLTAVVNPLGETVAQLPIFSDGVLSEEIFESRELTPFVRFQVGSMWWIVALATFGYVILRRLNNRRKKVA